MASNQGGKLQSEAYIWSCFFFTSCFPLSAILHWEPRLRMKTDEDWWNLAWEIRSVYKWWTKPAPGSRFRARKPGGNAAPSGLQIINWWTESDFLAWRKWPRWERSWRLQKVFKAPVIEDGLLQSRRKWRQSLLTRTSLRDSRRQSIPKPRYLLFLLLSTVPLF